MSLSEETVGGINFLSTVSLTKKCEDNGVLNKTYVYTYDNAGNITSKKTYALTAAGTTPTRLSSYTFSWTGRQLTGATKNNRVFSFSYNDEGISKKALKAHGRRWFHGSNKSKWVCE